MHLRHLRSFVLLFGAAILSSCESSTTRLEGPSESPFGDLSGVVTVDGVPIEGVVIRATGSVTRSDATNAEGVFAILDLPVGLYVLEAISVPENIELDQTEWTAQVDGGSAAAPLRIQGKKRRDAILLIRTYVDGLPRGGLTVSVVGAEERVGTTDGSGEARFTDLYSGRYDVILSGFDPTVVSFPLSLQSESANSGRTAEVRFDGVSIPQIPSAPDGLAHGAIGPNSIALVWNDTSDNETSFELMRAEAGAEWVLVYSGPDPSFGDQDLRPNTFYRYRVRSCGGDGCSPFTPEISATTQDVPPDAPSGLLALANGPDAVSLSWTDRSENETRFEVERSSGGSDWAMIGSPTIPSMVDAPLNPATTYSYRIRACNAVGCSMDTDPTEVTTGSLVPNTPTALQATSTGSATTRVQWVDSSENEDFFQVERKPSGGEWSTVASVVPSTFDDSGLSANTRYSYRVRACNTEGCSDGSAEAEVTTDDVAPDAPTGLAAVSVDVDRIDLTWTDASLNEDRFEVERRTGGGAWEPLTSVTGPNHADTGLDPGTTYRYRVRACNAFGCSEFSDEANATTPIPAPIPPTGLLASATGSTSVHLVWTDASSNESGFEVERRQGVGVWNRVGTVAGVTFDDAGLAPATEYDFRVRACNASGCSNYSNEATATTAPAAAGPNLTISALYIVQRTQRLAGDVPLVAGLDGFLRVFGQANEANASTPTIRVQFFLDGALAHTELLTAPAGAVPTSVSEGDPNSTWNVAVPGSLIRPGLSVLAEIDPGDAVAESDESDNLFPVSGVPATQDVRTTPDFEVTFVPVRQSVNGRVGDVNAGNADEYLREVRRMMPFGTEDVSLHAEYVTDAPVLQSGNGNSAWSTILSEINALRSVESASGHYYGVVNTEYNSGVAGIGYIGWPAALGWDRLPSGSGVAAHEWGHNFSRRHSPGCGAGNPDNSYPHAQGRIGAWGYDLTTSSWKSPDVYYDLMTYCGPEWISDYVYEQILDFRGVATSTESIRAAAYSTGVLVWGRVEGGEVVLEPAFGVESNGSRAPSGGAYRVEALDAEGRLIASRFFDPSPVADTESDAAHFAFVLPVRETDRARIDRLIVVSGGRTSAVQIRRGSEDSGAPVGDLSSFVSPGGGNLAEIRWDAAQFPMVLVRDADTGEVLTFGRTGRIDVQPNSDRIEILLSNGVSSPRRIQGRWR